MIQFSTPSVMASGTMTSNPDSSHLRNASMAWRPQSALGAGEAAGAGAGAGDGAGVAAGASAGLAAAPSADGLAAELFSALAFLPPSRKSVTYQPEPLSWKPAAVTCLLNALAPQAGHSERGASDIFCSTSLAKPQALHL